MRVGNRQFTPSLLMSVLYLLLGGAMLALGVWQLQRADEKISMQHAVENAAKQAPIDLAAFDPRSPEEEYTRIRVRGQFDASRQFFWDNRITGGKVGFEVITPLRTSNHQLLLVNRGWVPLGLTRESLPDISFGADKQVELTGVFSRPSIGFSSGDAVNLGAGEGAGSWPRILQHFDYDQISQALNEPVLPGVLQVLRTTEPGAESISSPVEIPLYQDNWQPVAFAPEKHYGYAFQWFAMFLALSALYFFLNSKKTVTSQSS